MRCRKRDQKFYYWLSIGLTTSCVPLGVLGVYLEGPAVGLFLLAGVLFLGEQFAQMARKTN